jgi:N-acetylmuramoyl-L-alanine amidase
MLLRSLTPWVLLATIAGHASANEEPDLSKEIECLALNIYHEARNEPESGKYAVGVVTMNRVHDPGYPETVCAVVWEKRWSSRFNRYVPQFSWTLDGKPDRPYEQRAWKDAVRLAEQVYFASPNSAVGDAKHYHASYVSPDWAQRLTRVTQIGQHIFYQ